MKILKYVALGISSFLIGGYGSELLFKLWPLVAHFNAGFGSYFSMIAWYALSILMVVGFIPGWYIIKPKDKKPLMELPEPPHGQYLLKTGVEAPNQKYKDYELYSWMARPESPSLPAKDEPKLIRGVQNYEVVDGAPLETRDIDPSTAALKERAIAYENRREMQRNSLPPITSPCIERGFRVARRCTCSIHEETARCTYQRDGDECRCKYHREKMHGLILNPDKGSAFEYINANGKGVLVDPEKLAEVKETPVNEIDKRSTKRATWI